MLRFRFTLAVCSIMAVTSLGHLAIGAPPDAPELNDVSLPEAVDDLPELLPIPATQTDASESATTTETDASEELEDATTEPVVAVEQEPAKQDAPKVSPEDQKGLGVEINKCKPGFPLRRISELNLDIRLKARADKDAALPPNAALCHFPKTQMHITGAETGALPCWYQYNHAFYHQPLYFEDPNLERCGWDACCLQPAISGAKFYAAVGLLPLKMLKSPPCCPVWALEDCLSCESYDDLDVLLNR